MSRTRPDYEDFIKIQLIKNDLVLQKYTVGKGCFLFRNYIEGTESERNVRTSLMII